MPLCKCSSRCMACIHIYYGDRPAVLHGRLVTIQNCHVLESSIDPYSDLDQLKSHIVDLLGVNLNSYQVHLEGVRPRIVPNTSTVVYTLFELRRNNAWALYVRKAVKEGFDLGVYVNVVSCPRSLDGGEGTSSHTCVQDDPGSMVADDAATGGVEAEEVVPTEGEVDAGCMDDEAGGSGDEDMSDEDDPQPAIQFFRAAGLLDCSVGDYRGLSGWGYRNTDIQIGQRFRDKAEVIHFLGNYAITTKREHHCTRSEPKAYEIRCTKHPDCLFFVRAHKSKHEKCFVISRHTTHSCTTDSIKNMSRIVDARYVVQLIVTFIGSDISLTLKSIMEGGAHEEGDCHII